MKSENDGKSEKCAGSALLDKAFLRLQYQASGAALIMFKLKRNMFKHVQTYQALHRATI